jgi:hypothetical protein
MKKVKNKGCAKCKGERVVFVKTNKKYGGYYEVCDLCNPSKEDKEGDFSGADGANSGER